MDNVLNWGLLSTAKINRALIKPLRASKRTRLLGVASRSQSSADEYAREWKIPRAYGSYESMLADPEIDIVSGPKLVMKFLEEFNKEGNETKVLDILSCDGGCINGPGVMTKEPLAVRRQKVVDYWKNIAKCG